MHVVLNLGQEWLLSQNDHALIEIISFVLLANPLMVSQAETIGKQR